MNVQPIDLGHELRQGVQLRRALAPIVICRPIACEFLHRRERHALGLICDGLLFGPLRVRDAATEVNECRFRNVDPEGSDRVPFPNWTGHSGLLSLTNSLILSSWFPGPPPCISRAELSSL